MKITNTLLLKFGYVMFLFGSIGFVVKNMHHTIQAPTLYNVVLVLVTFTFMIVLSAIIYVGLEFRFKWPWLVWLNPILKFISKLRLEYYFMILTVILIIRELLMQDYTIVIGLLLIITSYLEPVEPEEPLDLTNDEVIEEETTD